MVLLFLILCAYAVASGFKDGVLWSLKGADAFTWNEHLVFVAERATVLLAAFSAIPLTFWQVCVTSAAFALAFSFFHNQAYYCSRAMIAGQKWDFKYSSTTSTSVLEFDFKKRTAMLVAGVVVLVAGLIFLR